MTLRRADLETLVFQEISNRINVRLEMDAMLKKIENTVSVRGKRQLLTAERDRLMGLLAD